MPHLRFWPYKQCTAASAFLIHRTLGGKLAPGLLFVVGLGAMGAAIFPGYADIAHGIFAMVTFFSGGAAAVAFYRILQSGVMKYLSLASGTLVLGVLISLVVVAGSDPFTTTLGVGGVERLVVYPVVLWIIALCGHLTSLPVNKAQS
jgi:peptidoglycan/LPS O-acetylase OafA/YrhL